MARFLWLVVVLGACGSQGADEPPVPVPTGEHAYYVVTKQDLAPYNDQGQVPGLDLDGDTYADNALGNLLVLISTDGVDPVGQTSAALASGAELLVLDVQTDRFDPGSGAGLRGLVGANRTEVGIALDSSIAVLPELAGAVADDGSVDLGPGELMIELAALGDPIQLRLADARAHVEVRADGTLAGLLGGGVRTDDVTSRLLPQYVALGNAIIARDCVELDNPPWCGCPSTTTGRTFLDLFDGIVPNDAPDCSISIEEAQANTLVKTITRPDLADADGNVTLMSFGFPFEAKPVLVSNPPR